MGVKIRKIGVGDRESVFGWVEALGWNPGERDAECLLEVDSDGAFMAERDGKPVGCATGIAYDGEFGFVGALVVDPAMRGRGPATALAIYRHLLAHLGERNVGMDAMPATKKFFEATGCLPAYRHWRFEGELPKGERYGAAVRAAEIPFEAICAYDAENFPARREKFLRAWLGAYGGGGWAIERDGRLAGFGVVRRARRGWRVGPLLADDPAAAEGLLLAMGASCGGGAAALDVPESNAAAVALAKNFGMKETFETTRMYSRRIPDLSTEKTYSIASYEFG